MKSIILATVSALTLFAGNVVAQTSATSTVLALKPIQTMNCSKTNGTLQKASSYDFASDGWCQRLCGGANYPVMAMTAGSICYCGNTLPALDQAVSESNCDSPCAGFNSSSCGGIGYYQIYLTGLTDANVSRDPNSTSSTSSSSSSSATKAPATVVVTASTSPSGSSSGTNKVGIAVGVVVSLVVTASVIGAVVFFMKQRQKQAIEDEHRRLEAQAAALAAEKSDTASTRTDQRLDPSIFSHRRESIGSIADEMDFSRRILQVRNPDRFSTNSPVP